MDVEVYPEVTLFCWQLTSGPGSGFRSAGSNLFRSSTSAYATHTTDKEWASQGSAGMNMNDSTEKALLLLLRPVPSWRKPNQLALFLIFAISCRQMAQANFSSHRNHALGRLMLRNPLFKTIHMRMLRMYVRTRTLTLRIRCASHFHIHLCI